MEAILRVFRYLVNLEWTERKQDDCIFCDPANLKNPVDQNKSVIAIRNIRPAGLEHWLIMPREHTIRDIEALGPEHLPLLKEMDDMKNFLLEQKLPKSASPPDVVAGYHRGRRPFLSSKYYFPDIISIHHLHLHVIVQPRLILRLFKYPSWLPFMWKSDATVMQEVTQRATKKDI